jgi:pSer/pThr/pTyr-binding forkhead associated (FHA) protein
MRSAPLASFFRHDGSRMMVFAVNDLRSTNGTLVGEQRVLDSHFLRSGDVIRIGGTDLIFEMDA